ncbi:MAG: TatD family hydrolase [Desulfopila sp.]
MNKAMRKFPRLSPGISLIDSHCHLDMDAFTPDFSEVLTRAKEHGVHRIITIGIDLESSQRAIELSRRHDCLSATVGVHPHDVEQMTDDTYTALARLIADNRDLVVGYGEIGLDYVKQYSSAESQRRHFVNQLNLAHELALPIIIHDRQAHDDALRLIRQSGGAPDGGVMHCFSGNIDFARQVIDLGLLVSFPGVVTYRNAREIQDAAAAIPLESMLVETDGPFLAPHPVRGKRNEPVNVLFTTAYIAELRGISLDELARQTTDNACRLFGIDSGITIMNQ